MRQVESEPDKNTKKPWLIIGIFALTFGAYILLRGVFFDCFILPSVSMEPTLEKGDFIVISKYGYGNYRIFGYQLRKTEPSRTPQRGEIFVFLPPQEDRYFIKRIIGLPGDVIEQRDKQLFINGKPVTNLRTLTSEGLLTEKLENHTYQIKFMDQLPHFREFTVEVPAGHYFVMGDNRDNSADSRLWGPVPQDRFVGKVFID